MKRGLAVWVLLLSGAALCLGQDKKPFPDVPPGHWAAKAVESLHQEGVLVGYPADRELKLDYAAQFDRKFVSRSVKHWTSLKLIVMYPEGLDGPPPIEKWSKWDYMAAIFAVSQKLIQSQAGSPPPDDLDVATGLKEIPTLVKAISMCRKEFEASGVDAKNLVGELRRLTLFQG